ncbi:MAG: adenosine deaminase [Actinomycetes bacterium]
MVDPRDMSAFVGGLPKAELHLHLQGAASVETVLELARRHPQEGVPTGESELRAFYEFTDFIHFLEVYSHVNQLVKSADDVQALVVGLGRDLAPMNVRYAEVTVTADSHLKAGIAPADLREALELGRVAVRAVHDVELAYVYDINGADGLEGAERLVAWAERHLPEGSVGFGLGGPELVGSRPRYAPYFDRALALGLHSVPHAGETTGPQTIRDSLDHLHAERIGHGIAAAQDPELMAELADRGIALEVCPTSNVRTRAVASLDEHPFNVLRKAGVRLTLNTDDPGMFDTDINREYVIAHDVFGLDAAELTELARESVRASFAEADVKQRVLAEIDAYASTHAT